MKARLPWIVLVASVAFNAFFIVGYLRVHGPGSSPKTFRSRMKLLGKRLDLDEQQGSRFDALVGEQEKLMARRGPQREKMLAELTKDEPDEKVLEAFFEGDEARRHRRERMLLMQKLMKLLRPEQREKLLEQIKAHTSPSKR